MSQYLTHKEIELDLKEIKARIENLQNQINQFKQEFLSHRDRDNIRLL